MNCQLGVTVNNILSHGMQLTSNTDAHEAGDTKRAPEISCEWFVMKITNPSCGGAREALRQFGHGLLMANQLFFVGQIENNLLPGQ